MKRIKWHLLLIAALAIGVAFTTRPRPLPNQQSMHTYSFAFYNQNHTRMYYGMDLTAAGYIQGIDYDCESPTYVCTFIANPANALSDLSGNYFLTADVPVSGILDSGSWVDLD